MLFKLVTCFLCSTAIWAETLKGPTFKNVIVHGYTMYTHKFNVTIKSSNSLKENLPKTTFDRIDIINNEIPVLHENSISDMEDLDELILTNNGILEIQPGAFINVPQLRKLVITKNSNLELIKSKVFNNLNIATLDLSENSINTIVADAFNDMPELLNINLADNKLKAWNKNWFYNTPLLTRVSMQNNLIEEIPSEAFKNFKGDKQFGTVSLTPNIVLSDNKINKIHEDAFKGLDKINNLWLDGNQIDTWNSNLLSNIALKDLRLDNNKLVCLGDDTKDLERVFVAETTHIDGNPWNCTCLENIHSWASDNNKNVIMYYSKMTCDVERIDRKLKNLHARLNELKDNDEESMKL